MTVNECQQWWHLFGTTLLDETWWCHDESVTEQEARENPSLRHPVWATTLIGACVVPPDGPTLNGTVIKDGHWQNDVHFAYLGSWEHEPTQREIDEVTPEKYRGR